MAERPVRIAIAGCGKAAWTGHLPALTRSRRFEVVAVMDLDHARATETATVWHIGQAVSTEEALFALSDVDALLVATPPASHLRLARGALERAWHVYIEKPMVRTTAEAEELLRCLHRSEARAAVGHQMRFHPTYQLVARLIKQGRIGQPFFVGVHWATNVKLDPGRLVPAGYDNYYWRWRDLSVGGGIVQDHLPHIVDLVRYWTDSDPSTVYASTMNVARDLLGWPDADSVWEDFGLVAVRFDNGLMMRLETGTVGRSLSPIWSLGSGIGEWTQYGYILGTKGQLVFDLLPWDSSENGRVAIWQLDDASADPRGWTYIEQPEPARTSGSPGGAGGQMFLDQLEAFADLIEGRPSEIATLEDGRISVSVVEAAYAAAQSETVVRLAQVGGPAT